MASIKSFTWLFILGILALSCNEDEPTPSISFEYSASINSPSIDDKHVGEAIHIHVDFKSLTGQTVHHVKVRIYNKETAEEIYNQPNVAHIHETSGTFEFHDDFMLDSSNGVEGHTDWILEAKVWGHEEGVEEVKSQIEFHVQP